jgi:hypothetical protein
MQLIMPVTHATKLLGHAAAIVLVAAGVVSAPAFGHVVPTNAGMARTGARFSAGAGGDDTRGQNEAAASDAAAEAQLLGGPNEMDHDYLQRLGTSADAVSNSIGSLKQEALTPTEVLVAVDPANPGGLQKRRVATRKPGRSSTTRGDPDVYPAGSTPGTASGSATVYAAPW